MPIMAMPAVQIIPAPCSSQFPTTQLATRHTCSRRAVLVRAGPPAGRTSKQHRSDWQVQGQALGSRLATAALAACLAFHGCAPSLAAIVAEPAALVEPRVPESSLAGLSPEELSTIRVFQLNTPSVVNITNIRAVRSPTLDVRQLPVGTGSGFIWDNKGHVVTNFHVIKGASEVKVTLFDQSSVDAAVVGYDADKDTAVLKLEIPPEKAAELRPVTVGNSAGLLVGQKVLAIGNPFGLDHSLTSGIISGVGRELAAGVIPIRNVIQTDAAINPGNSGGVLLDSQGRLIGINAAIADPSGKGANAGVGFAIPIDTVKGLVAQILEVGRVVRPGIGITIAPPTALVRMGQEGVLVLDVPPGGPAFEAGLKPTSRDSDGNLILGDIIVKFNGEEIKQPEDLYGALDNTRVGDTVELKVLRDGKEVSLTVKLAERAQTRVE